MAFKRRKPKIGARPGELAELTGLPETQLSLVRFSKGGIEESTPSDVRGLRSGLAEDEVIWVSVQGHGTAESLRAVAKEFGLHALALADIVNIPQRPKLDRYDDHFIVIVRGIELDPNGAIKQEQISVVVGDKWVLSFEEYSSHRLLPVRTILRETESRIRTSGADYLAYALIDTVVDHLFPVIEGLAERVEALEDVLHTRPMPHHPPLISGIKAQLALLRRIVLPTRDLLNTITRDADPLVDKTTRIYFRDTFDHATQVTEVLESVKDTAAGLMYIYLSVMSNRTNEVMKVLTVLTSVFIPLTFLTSVYGMNFDHMPELKTDYGYYVLWGFMVALAAALLGYFRAVGWLGGQEEVVAEHADRVDAYHPTIEAFPRDPAKQGP